MPFTSDELSAAGKLALDVFIKNKPVDQIGVERPLMKMLKDRKEEAPGGKQFIVEQILTKYGSNFQWFNGSQVVTYNKRNVVDQVSYAWRSAHDGLAIDEDRLIQNNIRIVDGLTGKSSVGGAGTEAEYNQLTNLMKIQAEALRLGFQEKFSQALHLDGTQSSDAITGLDALISLTPTVGTVGGIDRSVAAGAFFRNFAQTGLTTTTTTGNILDQMEVAWRACCKNGGKPNKIIIGAQFQDGFRNFMLKTYGRLDFGPSSERVIEGGTSRLTFHGVEMELSYEFADLDAAFAPATAWDKRCYFMNTEHIKLRPIEGQDMITRNPPRSYDKYEYYWGITWRGAVTMNRGNAHAVLAVA